MSNYKILVVDDEPIIVKMLEISLESKGYEVRLATKGLEAIEALHKENFDLIITDIELGDLDGIAVLKKAKDLSPMITGVVMTGNHNVSWAIEAIRAGADDYFLKPFSLTELLDCVKNSIEKLELNQNLALKNSVVSSSKEQLDSMLLMSQTLSNPSVFR